MKSSSIRRTIVAAVGALALAVPLASCTSGGGGGTDGQPVEISYLSLNNAALNAGAEALVKEFNEANPGIKVRLERIPGGTEGYNLIKTKLSTGEMEDVFQYNSGSRFQSLSPDQFLRDLSDQPWVNGMSEDMKAVVSTKNGLYGAPWGSSYAGAVLYNKPIYKELGLKVPTNWAEFAANNEAIKAAGKTAVIQTYGETWTSQLFVLGDFANVSAQDPNWAGEYTAGKRKYAGQPAVQGFLNQEKAAKAGWFNADFASAKYDAGARMVATGEGAHYPMLTNAISIIKQNTPNDVENVGVFPLPAQDASDTKLTKWLPLGTYIPKSTEGAKLEAAKKFVAFVNSPAGCAIQTNVLIPSGPFATTDCKLPDNVPSLLKDMQVYYDAGQTSPALEFLSPVIGPNLPNIAVEVGSGIRSGQDAAALYDQDVKKAAQQLGLPGW